MQLSSELPVVEPGGWARDAGTAADAAVFVTTPRAREGAAKRNIPTTATTAGDAAFQSASGHSGNNQPWLWSSCPS